MTGAARQSSHGVIVMVARVGALGFAPPGGVFAGRPTCAKIDGEGLAGTRRETESSGSCDREIAKARSAIHRPTWQGCVSEPRELSVLRSLSLGHRVAEISKD